MNTADFKKLQSVQMEIMDEVHRVCTENDITYYIIGGTALGAVRHGGFIPWDLDIDIAMPRPDYEKFQKVCKEKMSARFLCRNYKNTKRYLRPHSLVCIKDTYLSTKSEKFNPNEQNLGIYMDIFPLDNAPDNDDLRVKQAEKIKKIKKLKLLKRGYRYGNDFKNTVVKKIVSLLLFWTNIDKINARFDKVCRKYENDTTQCYCSMASHYSYKKQCMPKEVYGKPQLIDFEDRKYYAPEKLEEYLTRVYGDYMKLPPEEERQINLGIFEKVVFDK